ncbi:histidine kinase, partial [Methanococcoides sp. SA1]|nr:histidine kinase [Methanococcoides sp. SA1]
MKWKDMSLKVKLVLYIVTGVFLILSASTSIVITTVTEQEEQLAYHDSIQNAKSFANGYDADMKANMAVAHTLAALLTRYDNADRDEINAMLEELLLENPDLLAVYVAFEPNAFDGRDSEFVDADATHDETGRFIPYWNKIGGEMFVEPLVDYDTLDYYQLTKELEQDIITEPYLYQGALIVSYEAPIVRDGDFIGIGGVVVELNYVDETVSSVKAFDT